MDVGMPAHLRTSESNVGYNVLDFAAGVTNSGPSNGDQSCRVAVESDQERVRQQLQRCRETLVELEERAIQGHGASTNPLRRQAERSTNNGDQWSSVTVRDRRQQSNQGLTITRDEQRRISENGAMDTRRIQTNHPVTVRTSSGQRQE